MMEAKPSSEASTRFMELFDLQFPIVQASMDGPVTPALTAAVSNAGALGGIPLTWLNADQVAPTLKDVQSLTGASFFCNYVLSVSSSTLETAMDAGMDSVLFSWGIPSPTVVAELKGRSINIGVQVTGEGSADAALAVGPDFLVCQGIEAGGHVQAYQPLERALQETLSVAGDVPVAAAGGMSTGHDIAKWLDAGAAACVFGTRFVATRESVAHSAYKQMLLDLTGDDTVYTVCLNNGWSQGTHRIFRNSTFTMWEAAGCPQPGHRPDENQVIASLVDDGKQVDLVRYDNNTPVESMTGDDVLGLGVYAGLGVDEITDLPSVADLIERLWQQYLDSA